MGIPPNIVTRLKKILNAQWPKKKAVQTKAGWIQVVSKSVPLCGSWDHTAALIPHTRHLQFALCMVSYCQRSPQHLSLDLILPRCELQFSKRCVILVCACTCVRWWWWGVYVPGYEFGDQRTTYGSWFSFCIYQVEPRNGFRWSGLLAAFTSADLSRWPSCNVFTVHTSLPTVLGL